MATQEYDLATLEGDAPGALRLAGETTLDEETASAAPRAPVRILGDRLRTVRLASDASASRPLTAR